MSDLPTTPSLRSSDEYPRLFDEIHKESILKGLEMSFSKSKVLLEEKYKNWEETFFGQHTSSTNRKIQFYKIAQEFFPQLDLGECEPFMSIVLSNLPELGARVEVPIRKEQGRVIRREVTSRLGVLFTIKMDDGELVSHEFFD
ncbi:MAG: hypothetical protein HC845_08760 [Akkermansiaceae bacterium]|nr:hypothetical protein [Akkermansiaceae bacterium]